MTSRSVRIAYVVALLIIVITGLLIGRVTHNDPLAAAGVAIAAGLAGAGTVVLLARAARRGAERP